MLLYLASCLLLTYTPPYLLLTQRHHRRGWARTCLVSGLVFVGVSALKLLVLGAIVPPYAFGSLSSTETSSLPLPPPSLGAIVFVRCTTRLFVDVAAFAAVVASSHTIAASAVGWAGAKALVEYLLGYLLGAGGLEFDPKFIAWAVESNLDLANAVSLAALICMLLEYPSSPSLARSFAVLGLIFASQLDEVFLVGLFGVTEAIWQTVAVKAVLNSAVGGATYSIYRSLHETKSKTS